MQTAHLVIRSSYRKQRKICQITHAKGKVMKELKHLQNKVTVSKIITGELWTRVRQKGWENQKSEEIIYTKIFLKSKENLGDLKKLAVT